SYYSAHEVSVTARLGPTALALRSRGFLRQRTSLDALVTARHVECRHGRVPRLEAAPAVRHAIAETEAARVEEIAAGHLAAPRHGHLETHPAALGREPFGILEKTVAPAARASIGFHRQLLDRRRHALQPQDRPARERQEADHSALLIRGDDDERAGILQESPERRADATRLDRIPEITQERRHRRCVGGHSRPDERGGDHGRQPIRAGVSIPLSLCDLLATADLNVLGW